MKRVSILLFVILCIVNLSACNLKPDTTQITSTTVPTTSDNATPSTDETVQPTDSISTSEDFVLSNKVDNSSKDFLKELAYLIVSRKYTVDEVEFKADAELTGGYFLVDHPEQYVYRIVFDNQIYGYFTDVNDDGEFYYSVYKEDYDESAIVYFLDYVGYITGDKCSFFDESVTLA